MKLNVQLIGSEKLQRQLKKLGMVAAITAREIIAKAALATAMNAKERAPVDRGPLRAGISTTFLNAGLTADVVAGQPYSGAVELGRAPGSMPPVEPLIEWARRKGIAGAKAKGGKKMAVAWNRAIQDAAVSIGWAIAMKMKKDGTPAKPYLVPAYDDEKGPYVEDMQRLFKINLEGSTDA